jgi:ABC-type glycerol-3-phosphate transport system permease component
MFFGSFKSPIEFSANPGGLPIFPTMKNYYKLFVFNGGSMLRAYFNSIFVSVCYTILSLVICSAAAFGFAKYHFSGRNAIFTALLSTMILPGELLIPPLYLMLSKIRMLDTYSVQIFPGIAGVFGMYLLRQNMLSIHDSILEAARIDGAGESTIFFNIGLPMSSPALGAFCILNGLGKFNDFMWPIFMVSNPKKVPIMTVLPMLTTGESQSVFSKPWELIMTGCVVATIPLLVLFLCFQEKIMACVTIGAVKE